MCGTTGDKLYANQQVSSKDLDEKMNETETEMMR